MPYRDLGLLLTFNDYWISRAILLCLALPAVVLATPSRGVTRNNTCSNCHTRPVTDRMRVTGEDLQLTLLLPVPPPTGTGRSRGGGPLPPPEPMLGPALKTFRVAPGNTVTLSIEVLNGSDRFAVQIKNFDNGAKKNSPDNMLFWIADNAWTRHQRGNQQPYFTKNAPGDNGIPNSVTPITYHFDLFVDVDTPLDVYELTFATVGRSQALNRWYQEEKFYLEVYCPYEMPGDFNRDCRVDYADFALFTENWLVDCLKDNTHPGCVSEEEVP